MNEPPFGTFRGADIYTGQMVFGWLRQTRHNWIIYNTGDSVDTGACNQTSVHPESLAMFTGIYDAEDKPIYGNIPLPDGSMSRGGDILSGDRYPYFNEGIQTLTVDDIKQNYVAIPSWNGDATYHAVGDVRGISHGLPINEELDELKIIGNEYENPELLEGES